MNGISMGNCYSQYTLYFRFIGLGKSYLRTFEKNLEKCDLALFLYLPNNLDVCFPEKVS